MVLQATTLEKMKRIGMVGLQLTYEEIDGKWHILLKQNSLPTLHIFTHEQLEDNARHIFSDEDINSLKITTEVYKFDSDEIDYKWIRDRMHELRLSRADIIDHLGIDDATISLLLAGKKELTKWHKATFYFYFMQKDLWDSIASQVV